MVNPARLDARGHMTKLKVGMIGVGLMGHGIAGNCLRKGHPLVVLAHRNRAPIEDLLEKGATEAKTPRELAAAVDVLQICVSGSPEVEAVVFGPDGIIAGAHERLIVVDCSTSDPVSTKRVAAALAEKGVRFVDAPLGRTPKEAEAGTLDAMIGADPETFAIVKPVIECWAGKIVHLGPVGAGHTMKLINNFISIGYAGLYSEALALGARSGVTPEMFHSVIGGGRMSCGFYDTFMAYVVGRDPNAHKFTLANAAKDMRYVANLATETDTATFLQGAIRSYLASAVSTGHGEDYLPMLADHVARLNGVSLGPPPAET